jgi:hypothetical protein
MSNQRDRDSAARLCSLFRCCQCGESFQSLPPPADTRPDAPNPMCNDCLERELDEVEPVPMSREEINSIVRRVVVTREMAMDAGDPCLEGQEIDWWG